MPEKFICENKKYFLSGPDADVIALPVSFSNLPKSIVVNERTLLLRSSFHVSLVCVGKIIEKYNVTIPDFLDKIIVDFCEFTKNKSIDFSSCRNEFRFASENDRRSVVVMCGISNLREFFDFINRKYSLETECPPTHITLYTSQPDAGIFLTHSGDIARLTKIIGNPIGDVLK